MKTSQAETESKRYSLDLPFKFSNIKFLGKSARRQKDKGGNGQQDSAENRNYPQFITPPKERPKEEGYFPRMLMGED